MQISISHSTALSGEESSKLNLIFRFAFVAHPLCNGYVFKSNQLGDESYRRSVNYFVVLI